MFKGTIVACFEEQYQRLSGGTTGNHQNLKSWQPSCMLSSQMRRVLLRNTWDPQLLNWHLTLLSRNGRLLCSVMETGWHASVSCWLWTQDTGALISSRACALRRVSLVRTCDFLVSSADVRPWVDPGAVQTGSLIQHRKYHQPCVLKFYIQRHARSDKQGTASLVWCRNGILEF
jgi:hypothetical protein